MSLSRFPLTFLIIAVALVALRPAVAEAELVLVEFTASDGASLVAEGDLVTTPGRWRPGEVRKPVRHRARAIARARATLLASLPPTLRGTVFGEYRNFPLIRADVDAAERSALEAHPQVTAVHHDHQRRLLTESSLAFMGASVWHEAGHQGQGTAVAVLDSGIRYWDGAFGNCPDAGAPDCQVAVFEGFAHLAWGSGSTDPYEVAERSGHGTNVGGIVGAVAPGTSLLSLGVFAWYEPDPESGFQGDVLANDGDVAEALDWVIERRDEYNIVAANLSLGGEVDSTETGYCSGWIVGAYETVFANCRAAGVLPVVASGNDYEKRAIAPPACVSSAVAVGAGYDDPAYGYECGTGPVVPGAVACFSDSNALIDLVAPGNDIDAGGLFGFGGTSMAAPHVAGLVALYVEQEPTAPIWTVERMRVDAVPVIELGPEQVYVHRSARIGDHEAVLTFDTGAVLASDFHGLSIPDGSEVPLVVEGDVVCETELCASDVVGNVYLDLSVEHFGTGDLSIELESPDGVVARHEVADDEELGLEHVNSILGSQHLVGVFDGLAGAAIEGAWTLRLFDDTSGREGDLYQAVLLVDSARVEMGGELATPGIARPDEPFAVSLRLANEGNLAVESADLTIELVDEVTEVVIDEAPLVLELPSSPGQVSEHQVELVAPQGQYEVRLAGALGPDLPPGLQVEPIVVDVTYRTFASFMVDPGVPEPGSPARLSVISRGLVEQQRWDFGDGSRSIEAVPTHVWDEAGEYEVTLVVTGPDGISTTSREVTVVEPPPDPAERSERALNVGGGGCSCDASAGRSRAGGALLMALALLAIATLRRRHSLAAVALSLSLAACWGDDFPVDDAGPSDADLPEVVLPEPGPWVSLLDPADPSIGDVPVFVMLSSEEPGRCDLTLDWRRGEGDWAAVTLHPDTPATDLASCPEGIDHSLVWLATEDIPGDAEQVQLRAQASCDQGETLTVMSSRFQALNFFETNPRAVLISEVSTADDNLPADINGDYVELVNRTDEAIPLDGWLLVVGAAGGSRTEHSLDGARLEPEGRLVVAEADAGLDGALLIEGELPWTVVSSGWVAVVASFDRGVDFARWGGSAALPPSGLLWEDDPPLPVPQTLTALSRIDEDDDGDRASDFCISAPSPGADNDLCVLVFEPSDLLITELDSQGTNDQVEVLNRLAEPVNLGGWVILWDGGDLGAGHIPLGGVELGPGERVVLRDNGTAGRFRSGILELGENLNIDGLVPISLGLQDPHGQVIDFLAGGGSPIRWMDWDEAEPTPMPGPRTTLSRRPGDPDTDSAADFCLTDDNLLAGAEVCLEPMDITLVISEVMPGRPDWVEVYNPGPDPVDLAEVYVSYTAPYYGGSVGDYRLRGTLEPGALVVLSERPLDDVSGELTTAGDNIALAPEGDGSVTLRDIHGFGIDFVMWGEPAGRPLWPDQWLGLGADTHGEDDSISIQRYPEDAEDSDGRDDWCWADPSPGEANEPCE